MTVALTLEGRTILVTGASSGVGRATAVALSGLGARVVLNGRRVDELEKTRVGLSNPTSHVLAPFDLAETREIPAWLRGLPKELGKPLDGVLHAAGIHNLAPLRIVSPEQVEAILNLNAGAGICLLAGLSLPGVLSNGASVVLLSSVAASMGEAGLTLYSASKAALLAAARCAAAEMARRNIRVNCLQPGLIDAGMTDSIRDKMPQDNFQQLVDRHPLGLGRLEDVTGPAAFLLSDLARWITGASLVVDGGYSCR